MIRSHSGIHPPWNHSTFGRYTWTKYIDGTVLSLQYTAYKQIMHFTVCTTSCTIAYTVLTSAYTSSGPTILCHGSRGPSRSVAPLCHSTHFRLQHILIKTHLKRSVIAILRAIHHVVLATNSCWSFEAFIGVAPKLKRGQGSNELGRIKRLQYAGIHLDLEALYPSRNIVWPLIVVPTGRNFHAVWEGCQVFSETITIRANYLEWGSFLWLSWWVPLVYWSEPDSASLKSATPQLHQDFLPGCMSIIGLVECYSPNWLFPFRQVWLQVHWQA